MGIRQIEKLKKGDMIDWYFYVDGKKLQRSTGQRYDTAQSLKVAQRIGEELEARIRAEAETPQSTLTVGDLHTLVTAHSRSNVTRPKYDKDKKGANIWFNCLYRNGLPKDTPVAKITEEKLYAIVDTLKKPTSKLPRGYSGSTMRRVLILGLKRGLDLAVRKEKLDIKKTKLAKLDWKDLSEHIGKHIPNEALEGRYIEQVDYLAVCAAVSESTRKVLEFVYNTGVRYEEMMQIKASMVASRNGQAQLNLPGWLVKVKSQARSIPLNGTALAAVRYHLSGDATFPDVGKKLAWVCDEVLQVERITLRDLRHTFATNLMRRLNGDVASVARIMGHSKEMCYRYLHPHENNVNEAIAAMG